MPMVTCKECGKEVSSEAKECPHCGVKLKAGIFEKARKQAGGLAEKAKDTASKIDMAKIDNMARKATQLGKEHSSKVDTFLLASFKFGKFLSAFLVSIFFLVFIGSIGYYFLSGGVSFDVPNFDDDGRPYFEKSESLGTAPDFSDIDQKRKVENKYGSKIKKIIAFGFAASTYDGFVTDLLDLPSEYRGKYINGLHDFLTDGIKYAKKNNKKQKLSVTNLEKSYRGVFNERMRAIEMQKTVQKMEDLTILGVAGGSLLLFIVFLLIPILIKVEENTRLHQSL